nr:flagellar type III secretion system pore protein FliP [Heliomicrobium undosum]
MQIPTVSFGVESTQSPTEVSSSLQILFLLTILSLAPSILIMMTCFTRIIVVLHFTRTALALQTMPPNQILIGLTLFLTFFIMAPTWTAINNQALQPYLAGSLSQEQALEKASDPLREFMLKQTREKDLALFVNMSDMEQPQTYRDIPTKVVIPAFILSELKTAFQIGAVIYLPFIVIDMIVGSVLMSMGMMMLPPMMISLPFKVLVFVLVDGWYLIVRSLILSYQ